MKQLRKKHIALPLVQAVLCLAAILFLISKYSEYDKLAKEKELRDKVKESLILKKSKLEQSLYSRIYFTKSVAAYISVNNDISESAFVNLASQFIKGDSVISTMSIARNCIIGTIYPFAGHEKAVGLNLLAHPQRKAMVEQSIITHKTFIAGPVELVEGGSAFISYTPVFSIKGDAKTGFWGVTDITIYRDKLFKEVGLEKYDEDFKFALSGYDGDTRNKSCFWGDSTAFENNPVTVEVLLPTGSWTLAASAKTAWSGLIYKSEALYLLLYLSAFIISILVWLWLVALAKLRANSNEMKAIFGSMEDLIIEYDKEGEYLQIAPTNEKLLVQPKSLLIGKMIHEVLDKELADNILVAIRECLDKKSLVEMDYQLNINNKDSWFRARISPLTDQSVLFLVQDITQKKLYEMALIDSERKLKESNNQKDKFFSIIAHDLSNPLGNFRMVTKMLHENYNEFTEDERKEFLELMNESSSNIYSLLKNLLEWARSQRGGIVMEPTKINLENLAESNVVLLKLSADQKQIQLKNSIDKGIQVFADANLLTTIIRNMISNSIKFTNENGTVQISAETNDKEVVICVQDNGVGMPADVMKKLFRIDENISGVGTKGETGTGLGLILCKEFVTMQGGRIWVESEPGRGSKFFFTMPRAE